MADKKTTLQWQSDYSTRKFFIRFFLYLSLSLCRIWLWFSFIFRCIHLTWIIIIKEKFILNLERTTNIFNWLQSHLQSKIWFTSWTMEIIKKRPNNRVWRSKFKNSFHYSTLSGTIKIFAHYFTSKHERKLNSKSTPKIYQRIFWNAILQSFSRCKSL